MKHIGPVVADREGLRVIDCKECGWCHLEVLPDSDDVLMRYYTCLYYKKEDGCFDKERMEHSRNLWDTAYSYQMELLGNSPLIIDWGAGAGWFLQWLIDTKKPCECIGIEPSDVARSYLKDIGYNRPPWIVKNYNHMPLLMPANHRASLVFEHILDPVSMLNQMKVRLYRKILIIVPNEMNIAQRYFQRDNAWWVSKLHLNYWTPQGLRNLARKANMKVVYETSTFPMEFFLAFSHFGKDYRTDDNWGKKCHEFRLHFEKRVGRIAFDLYHLLYSKWKIGRELMFVLESI